MYLYHLGLLCELGCIADNKFAPYGFVRIYSHGIIEMELDKELDRELDGERHDR